MSMLSAHRWVCVSSVVALGAVLVGCSSAATPTAAPTNPPSASPAVSSAALDGADLGGALLPASAMPPGFKLDTSGQRDTGTSSAPDTTQPESAPEACDLLQETSWIDAGGTVAGSFAQNDYVNSADTEEIAQEADAFNGTDAEHAMASLWQLFGKCAHFTDVSGGTSASITLKRSQPADAGDQAYEAVQTSPAYEGGTTIVAVRVGNVIVSILDSSSGSDDGSAALGYAKRVAQNVGKQM